MPQFAGCLVLEWGWGFLVGVGTSVILLTGALIFLVRRVGVVPRLRLPSSAIVIEKFGFRFRVNGLVVNVLIVLVPIGFIGYFVYKGYDNFKDSYSVATDSPTIGVELQALRDKFQDETQATILVNDRAKHFLITGSYEGACVRDMFDAVCRKYASKLSCDTSWLHRTLTIDQVE